jgi:hypothetical protein
MGLHSIDHCPPIIANRAETGKAERNFGNFGGNFGDRREWRLIKDMFFCRPAGHARQAKLKSRVGC